MSIDFRFDAYKSVNTKISSKEQYEMSQLFLEERYQLFKLLLEQNYPVIYVFIHSIILGYLSIAAIVSQILEIMNYPTLSTNGSGVLAGTYFLIAIILALIVG
jgi:hypothetical protein